ncbi:MAG: hypothetical protein ACOY58_04085 [Candidatus Micrarchaeota archaeon]
MPKSNDPCPYCNHTPSAGYQITKVECPPSILQVCPICSGIVDVNTSVIVRAKKNIVDILANENNNKEDFRDSNGHLKELYFYE